MQTEQPKRLSFFTKLIYGSGDWGISSIGMLRSVFYAIYLTDVVGLEPRLASLGALLGVVWDAINDPLVGMISDRVRTRWGRRRPFFLLFAIPFGLSFIILWWAPNWDNQIALLAYVTLAFAISDTLTTLMSVPYMSLMPEIARDYDERTSLMGFRTFFQLAAALTVVVTAPAIVDTIMAHGMSQQQGFLVVATIFGALGAIPFFFIFFIMRETATAEEMETPPFAETLRTAWSNIPFRFAVGMHMFNWSAVDMVAVSFSYFLIYWVGQGDLLAYVDIFGIKLAYESAFFGILMAMCIVALPFWMWLAKKRNKREAYVLGMAFWALVQLSIFTVQPGQIYYLLFIGALAGIGVSSAYVLPDSIFADIIEWDELRTGHRQEGIYFGARAFIRKLSGAVAIFIALQTLGWAGYQSPPDTATYYMQPDSALFAIRLLVAPLGALLLLGALTMAWFYPLTREKHGRIRKLLERRKDIRR